MLTVPKSRVVRGFSFFGVSFVYVIFEEGTDVYWARSRVLEYLSSAARRLPQGVTPSLGPDATGVGWVYQYVVRGAQRSLAELRTIQDWYFRFGLSNASGVAEVASVGGFVKQYSVVIDPRRLQALGIPLSHWRVIKESNMDVGGRTSKCRRQSSPCAAAAISRTCPTSSKSWSRTRAAFRCCSRTWRASSSPPTSAAASPKWTARARCRRHRPSALRRERALGHRQRQTEYRRDRAEPAEGVSVEAVYDRSLSSTAIDTLKRTLIEESLIVALVCVIFLLHARSALVAIITLPLGILIAYICM